MSQKTVSPKLPTVKLSTEQRRRVRELVTDEGYNRAEAVAWVLAFEPSEVTHASR